MKLSNDAKTAIALGAGALYVYIGVKKEEAANWTFDALLVVGILLIGTILYGLFKQRSNGKRRKATTAPFERPSYTAPVLPPGNSNVPPAPSPVAPIAKPAQKAQATPAGDAAPFAPFSASDSLAEWTTTAPGQNSWDPTLTPIYQKPGAPPLQDIQGFSFK